MSKQPDNPAWPSRFQRSKTMAIYWYNKATDLRGAAGLVWNGMKDEDSSTAVAAELGLGAGFSFRVACWPPYLLLCGLALELILKAAAVAEGRDAASHHRLVDLWRDAQLPLTSHQGALLEILTESVYWAGRYPTPFEEADFDRFAELTGKHLWDEVTIGNAGLVVRRPNANLDWPSFSDLWSAASASPAIGALFDHEAS